LLLRGLETHNGDWLRAALADKLHQPYRQTLIPGYAAVEAAAQSAGAYGMVISGAGPTVLALTAHSQAEAVARSMQKAWATAGIAANSQVLAIDDRGAVVGN
jgi:homoserine kinase